MALLSNNWITEPLIDFEYKQYILLDYIKKLNQYFDTNKIYPYLSDIKSKLESLKNLSAIKEDINNSKSNNLKELTGFDFKEFKLVYKKRISESEAISEIEAIIEYALPLFKNYWEVGENLKKIIDAKLQLSPIGILPIRNKDGYLLLNQFKKTRVYRYHYSTILNFDVNKRYQDIKTVYLTTVTNSITNTFENIKYVLLKEYKDLSNPAVYLIDSDHEFPFIETVLPLAKQKLLAELNF
jgi:hypothetical protein